MEDILKEVDIHSNNSSKILNPHFYQSTFLNKFEGCYTPCYYICGLLLCLSYIDNSHMNYNYHTYYYTIVCSCWRGQP
jgi:hypothetical protein